MRWMSRNGAGRDFTYDGLRRATNRFANVLGRFGIDKGDDVATLAGRIPCLYIAVLGTLKNRSVYTPLYSAFGPDPIVSRMTIARARVLVTTDVLYRKKVEPVRRQMPALEHVLRVRETAVPLPPATHDFNALLDAASDDFTIPPTDPQDLALLTSRAAPPDSPRVRCTSTKPSPPTTPRLASRLISIPATMIVDEADFEAERYLVVTCPAAMDTMTIL